MKKTFSIIFTIVALVAFFTACSAVSDETETVSTTAVTDENGVTHYYEVVTDEENQTVLNEIKTDEKGKPVTDSKGGYEIAENSKYVSNTIISSGNNKTTSKAESNDDNEVTFREKYEYTEPDPNTLPPVSEKNTESEKPSSSQSVTDKDGWINKWY